MTEQENSSTAHVIATASGAIAGIFELGCIWPMEMIKTNMQLGTMRAHYTGLAGGFQYHVNHDGVLSLYRGMAPVMIGTIPKAAIRFGAFDYFKGKLAKEDGSTTPLRNLAAGTMAGAIEATLATTPIETMKTKLISANMGVWEGTKMIVAKEGLGGLYRGLFATVLKESSNQGLRFMCFTEYKRRISPEVLERYHLVKDAENMSSAENAVYSLIGGVSAGIFSCLGNNPFDVVKTRMQSPNASQYRNTFNCFRQLYQQGGIKVFYSGMSARLGRVIPGQGVIFMSYDAISRALTNLAESNSQHAVVASHASQPGHQVTTAL